MLSCTMMLGRQKVDTQVPDCNNLNLALISTEPWYSTAESSRGKQSHGSVRWSQVEASRAMVQFGGVK